MNQQRLMNNNYCGQKRTGHQRSIRNQVDAQDREWTFVLVNEVRQRLIRIHFPHKCVRRGRNLFFQTLSSSLFSPTTLIILTVSGPSSATKDFVISSNFPSLHLNFILFSSTASLVVVGVITQIYLLVQMRVDVAQINSRSSIQTFVIWLLI